MKDYTIEQIRNVVVAGHGGTGKTSLIECMAFLANRTTRIGKIEDGNTVCDYGEDEKARKMSLFTSICPVEWKGKKLNILDTPGFADFVGDVVGSMSAVETALIVVDGSGVVEVGTDNAMENASNAGNSKIIFMNKRDKDNMNWTATCEALKEAYGNNVVPVFIPIGKESSFNGLVDILNKKAYVYNGKNIAEEGPIPDDLVEQTEEMREALIESIAETDDELLEKFFEAGTLSEEEIAKGFKEGIKSGSFVPILVGSSAMNIGIDVLMDFIANYAPAPVAEEGPLKARVFKTIADPYVGKLTYFKVVSGSFKSDSKVYDINQEKEERVGKTYYIYGKEQEPANQIIAGDIGAVAKLVSVQTGDTLTTDKNVEAFPPLDFPNPVYSLAVFAANKAAEDKMGPSFQKIMEEDPTFKQYRDPNTGETIIASLGDYQLGIILEKIKKKFGVEVTTQTPKIAYRETITKRADCRKKHKKQTGGSGQYGDAHIVIEPNEPGKGYEFIDKVDSMRSEGLSACFLVIRLSQFDTINSSYGYRVGNQILKRFANVLLERVANKGSVYRLDGAKYVLALPNFSEEELMRLYNRLRYVAGVGLELGDESISLLFNGAALRFQHIDLEPTTILSELQYALNLSKQENNGELVYLDDQLHGRTRRSMEILDAVKRSVFNDCRGFYMVYQPQVDDGGRLVGAEALLRWRDDLWGMVYPDEYIPALENSLCFYELGKWILRTALTEFKTLLNEYPHLCLSVNISYRQLEKRNFCRDVIKTIQETGFPAEHLILELTEHCHSMSADLLRQKLDFLRENKIRISADDFGTGYSSLHMLRELSFDEIKIEKSFVLSMNENKADKLLVEAIIDCAKKFGIKTCAEGVETLGHFNQLRELGVNRYQGYFFSKPVSLPELKQYSLIHN